MKDENKKSIEFTKEQYESLAKIVYLGNWMANAQRTGAPDDPHMEQYEKIADHVYSFAEEFGFPDDFEAGLEFSDGEEEDPEATRLHEEYDNQNFWEELPNMLGERDFFRKYSKDEIEKMGEDGFMKRMECEIVWEEELEKHGIERLGIIITSKNMSIEELAAISFSSTQADAKIKRENIQGQGLASIAHREVGAKVRKTIIELGGTIPENLPTEESIREPKKRLRAVNKKLLKGKKK